MPSGDAPTGQRHTRWALVDMFEGMRGREAPFVLARRYQRPLSANPSGSFGSSPLRLPPRNKLGMFGNIPE